MNTLDELKEKLIRETERTPISPAVEAALLREFDNVAHALACRVEFTQRLFPHLSYTQLKS